MKTLAIIPVKAHSTRFPDKHTKALGNINIVERAARQAVASKCFDEIWIVSSSHYWVPVAAVHDAQFIERPKHLEELNIHVLRTIEWLNQYGIALEFERQVLLQATNPCRTIQDIQGCMKMLEGEFTNSVCTVVDMGEVHPSRMFKKGINHNLSPYVQCEQWTDTQQLRCAYMRDGGVYAWKRTAIVANDFRTLLPQVVKGYEVPIERSIRIDTESDFARAEKVLTGSDPVA